MTGYNENMKKIKVGIIGHTGRLGKPLLEMFLKHPFAEVAYTESRSEGVRGNMAEAEIVFLALPYGESERYLKKLSGKRIIDLSIDHRDDNTWAYGLSEIFGDKIKKSKLVANPGCYATSILLGLFPLRDKIKSVQVASTSGVSGAGMASSKNDNFLAYKEGRQHPQIKEIEKAIGLDEILFVPQRIDTAERGIISTMFVQIDNTKSISELYAKTYAKHPFVRMKKEIETKNVVGTNFCDIKILEFEKNAVIIAALDNLIKGGSGQAIQNFNLMCGFEETTGLL
ncbi:MAG: Asd/ArgC dimerization domain-containing protein [Candidatus Moranbacteria bacterium]|nr:Asd/ArgC dimerization domain-containing protein [Candidatus Moranbacteria bacterium]